MKDDADSDAAPRFAPIQDRGEIKLMLSEAIKSAASTVLWTKNQERVVNTLLSGYNDLDDSLTAVTPKNFDAEGFKAVVTQLEKPEIFFSVSLARANVFFKCDLIGITAKEIRFTAPKALYKVQRRKSFRLPIPDGYVVYAEFDDPLFPETRQKKKLIDISAGGVSFYTNIEDQGRYTQGQQLKQFSFKIKNRDIQCIGEVRHSNMLSGRTRSHGVKVGVQFKGLRVADVQFIAAYVFEESRKYFTKFM